MEIIKVPSKVPFERLPRGARFCLSSSSKVWLKIEERSSCNCVDLEDGSLGYARPDDAVTPADNSHEPPSVLFEDLEVGSWFLLDPEGSLWVKTSETKSAVLGGSPITIYQNRVYPVSILAVSLRDRHKTYGKVFIGDRFIHNGREMLRTSHPPGAVVLEGADAGTARSICSDAVVEHRPIKDFEEFLIGSFFEDKGVLHVKISWEESIEVLSGQLWDTSGKYASVEVEEIQYRLV